MTTTRDRRKMINPLVKLLNENYDADDNLYVALNINRDTYAESLWHNRSLETYDQIISLVGSRLGVKLMHVVGYKGGDINADDVFNIVGYDFNLYS